jgi:hypothetical protein
MAVETFWTQNIFFNEDGGPKNDDLFVCGHTDGQLAYIQRNIVKSGEGLFLSVLVTSQAAE